MSNHLKNQELRGRFSVGALILTLAVSAGAFGCTTNHVQSAGEPATITMAGGSAASRAVITPATAGAPPMISTGAVDPSVDAIAVLEASRGYQGRVLGPAAPGNNTVGISQQYATGQFVPPAVYLGAPQTINSSISSVAVPAVVSGAGEGAVVAAGMGGGLVASATAAPVVPNALNTGANFGVTGASNATATGIAGSATPATSIAGGTNLVAGTAIASAPTASSVLATPTIGTSARLNVNTSPVVGTRSATGVRVETSSSGRTVVTNSNP